MNTDSPLDSKQLHRIEAVHRGFLYQHLYTAGILLLSVHTDLTSILVEHDEDIELVTEDTHIYVQVKTRESSLQPNDIAGTLARFDHLRKAHTDGDRDRKAEFWIVSNAPPSPRLQDQVGSLRQRGISVAYPGQRDPLPPYLLPPSNSIAQLFASCQARAADIPWLCIRPDSLVWKLAALVQFSASGTDLDHPHVFEMADLPTLLEQVAVDMQNFPASPSPYYAQENEPSFFSEEPVRLMLGLSGSGKTSWVAEAVKQWVTESVYFDIGDTSDAAVATAAAREIAGHLCKNDGEGRSRALFLGKSGQEQLRLLDAMLRQQRREVVLVIDNVHHAEARTIAAMIATMSRAKWLLIGQPTPNTKELEHLLEVTPEELEGWSTETVGGVFHDMGVPIGWNAADRTLKLAGRLPLFVIGMARLALASSGSVEDLIHSIERGEHTTITPQEAILRQVHAALSDNSRGVAAAISICDAPLEAKEVLAVLSAASLDAREGAAGIRLLAQWGVLQVLQDGRAVLHDAYRTLAQEEFLNKSLAERKAIRTTLKDVLLTSLGAKPDAARAILLMRLMADLRETKALVGLVTGLDEILGELGLLEDARPLLEGVASDESVEDVDRFWAIDTLAYWDYQAGRLRQCKERVAAMARVLKEEHRGPREQTGLAMKRMIIAGKEGRPEDVLASFEKAASLNADDPEIMRILRYDMVFGLFHAGADQLILAECAKLIEDYYDLLGLTPQDVVSANPPEIWDKLRKSEHVEDDLKRLADTLELRELALKRQGRRSPFGLLHAHKFYVMSSSYTSAVRIGLDVVDQLLDYGSQDARLFIEQALLPMIRQVRLVDHVLPVRSQYAVVLAYCGEHEAALAELTAIERFTHADDNKRKEFENQRALVHKIVEGKIKLHHTDMPRSPVSAEDSRSLQPEKVGRNERCPCGSGKKYKRCCQPR